MDDVAGPAFKDMSDLYEAKTGLLSKAKVDKAQLSKLKQLIKDNPKSATLIFGILGLEGAKVLGLDPRDFLAP